MKIKNVYKKIYTNKMIQVKVKEMLSFWNKDLHQLINVMSIDDISKKNKKKNKR